MHDTSSQDTSLCMTLRPGYLTVHDSRGILTLARIGQPAESSTVRYPGLRSHAQRGILARGVMHSEVSWFGESCTVRYPGLGSHAQ